MTAEHTHADIDQLTIGCPGCIARANAGHLPKGLVMSETRRRTLRNKRFLEAGIHPLRRTTAEPERGTCGTCTNAHKVQNGARAYWKCKLVAITGGPGTDLVLAWPACRDHSPAGAAE